jgi:ATP-dependent Lon protease
MKDTIIPALQDRMEIIEITSYIEQEKEQIARKFLIPKQIKEHGLEERTLSITDKALQKVINSHTREAGVRNLERQIATICRAVAKEVASGNIEPMTIDEEKVTMLLGPTKFYSDVAERIDEPGIATEANKMNGKGKLVLTGHLGEVMKESAQAALSYIRARTQELKVEENFNDKYDIHIHVPAGAIPKDGPSAGVTIFSALLSLLTGRRVCNDLAMTGEISLRGKVLPVGGIKEKILAAHRAGIKKVVLPEKNRADLDEIPETVKKEMKFIPVKDMGEVQKHALQNNSGRSSTSREKKNRDWPEKELYQH